MQLTRFKLDDEYDPLNPDESTLMILQTCPINGVNLPASQGTIEAFDNRILNDPQLRRSFRFFILAGLGLLFQPQANDVLTTAEGHCRILGATPLNPAGDGAIIYNVGATLDVHIKMNGQPEPTFDELLTV